MRVTRVAPFVLLAAGLAACTSTTKEAVDVTASRSARSVVNISDVTGDPHQVATQIAGIAKRCWQGKVPAFQGLAVADVAPGSDPARKASIVNFRSTTPDQSKLLSVAVSRMSETGPGMTFDIAQKDVGEAEAYIVGAVDQILRRPQSSCPKPNLAFR